MTNDPSNESAQTFAYTYYLDGNQRTKTEGTKVTTYAYDYAGRLVSEVTTDNGTPSVGYTYTYDDFGNRLTMTTDGVTTNYTYDLNNRLLQTTANETTVTYTYNANGDMITEYKVVENIPEQNTTYTYSVYTGLLSSVSSTVGNVNASYDYNASGLRMKNGDTYFIYDGQNIVAEYDLANDEYIAVYGYAVNRVSRFTSGVDGEIYLFNAHGDVVSLVAISGKNVGKTIKEYDYDAFGNEVFPDPDDENPFRYCGEYYDKGTNRLYLRARDYDSATGRFTSEDTHWNTGNMLYGDDSSSIPSQAAFRQSANLYSYCLSNPVAYGDSSGQAADIIFDLIGIGWSIIDFVSEPSLFNAAMLAWDIAAAVIPFVPGSYVKKAVDIGITVATKADDAIDAARAISSTTVKFKKVIESATSVWSMDKFARGVEIERLLGGMCSNFPVIDKFVDGANKIASSITSIKSIDLMKATYQKGNNLFNKIMKYGDQLANFSNTTWAGTIVNVDDLTKRILEIAIPPGATREQMEQIARAIEELGKKGIEVVVDVIN